METRFMSLTVASIVRNESERFLPAALRVWSQFADRIVVLIDGTSDDVMATEDLVEGVGGVHAVWDGGGMQGNEWKARKALWEFATPHAEWLLHLDADQILSSDPRKHLKAPSVAFRVFDLWSPDSYREDAWWQGHRRCWWKAIHAPSYADHPARWNMRGWHSGHLPMNLPGPVHPTPIECSVLHYAYASPELRAKKAEMYADLGPHLTPKERFHAKTITGPNPQTKELPFTPEWRLL